jgi:hypothetical protein
MNGAISSCSASSKTISIYLSKAIPADVFEIHIGNAIQKNPLSTTPSSTFSFQTFDAQMNSLDTLNSGILLICT